MLFIVLCLKWFGIMEMEKLIYITIVIYLNKMIISKQIYIMKFLISPFSAIILALLNVVISGFLCINIYKCALAYAFCAIIVTLIIVLIGENMSRYVPDFDIRFPLVFIQTYPMQIVACQICLFMISTFVIDTMIMNMFDLIIFLANKRVCHY